MQRHFLYGGSRKSCQTFLPPLLYQVVEGLLSPVLHGQTLGSVLGCGEGTKAWTFTERQRETQHYRQPYLRVLSAQLSISMRQKLSRVFITPSMKFCCQKQGGVLRTNDVRVVDALQDLRLCVQTLLVHRHLLVRTPVDLLDRPRRRVHLSHPETKQIDNRRRSYTGTTSSGGAESRATARPHCEDLVEMVWPGSIWGVAL